MKGDINIYIENLKTSLSYFINTKELKRHTMFLDRKIYHVTVI